MSQKPTAKAPFNIRIDPSLESQIRQRAKLIYGDEKKAGALVEEGMTKYLASEIRGEQLESILSATEGALYNRISKRMEKEITSFIDRSGDLIASMSYEATLATLMLENQFLRGNSKEKYEDLRNLAHQRLTRRFKKKDTDQEIANLAHQNKTLEGENLRLQEEIKRVQSRNQELEEQKKNLEQESREKDQINQQYRNTLSYLISKQEKSITGKTLLPKSIQELIKDYTNRAR